MSVKSKYVVGARRVDGMLEIVAFVFPDSVIHADLAVRMFGSTKAVLGAGFVQLQVDLVEGDLDIRLSGESTSIGVHSRVEDKEYVAQALGLIDKVERRTLIADRDTFIARGLARSNEGIPLLGIELAN